VITVYPYIPDLLILVVDKNFDPENPLYLVFGISNFSMFFVDKIFFESQSKLKCVKILHVSENHASHTNQASFAQAYRCMGPPVCVLARP
jgi:hypothetical protein